MPFLYEKRVLVAVDFSKESHLCLKTSLLKLTSQGLFAPLQEKGDKIFSNRQSKVLLGIKILVPHFVPYVCITV